MKRINRIAVFILACSVIFALSYYEQTMVDVIFIYGMPILFTAIMTLGFYLVPDSTHNDLKNVVTVWSVAKSLKKIEGEIVPWCKK